MIEHKDYQNLHDYEENFLFNETGTMIHKKSTSEISKKTNNIFTNDNGPMVIKGDSDGEFERDEINEDLMGTMVIKEGIKEEKEPDFLKYAKNISNEED